jgi:tetratricopeptide (TPR) repeat protein
MTAAASPLQLLRSDIAGLVSQLRTLADPAGPIQTLLAAVSEAETGDVLPLKDAIHELTEIFDQLRTHLHEAQVQSERLENVERVKGSSEESLSRLKLTLREPSTRIPGVSVWLQTFAECLAAWRLNLCERLTGDEFLEAPELRDLQRKLRRAIRALGSDNRRAALPGLMLLLDEHKKDIPKWPRDAVSRAAIWVLVGRIRLYDCRDDKAALACFEQARAAMPYDGRIYAALAEYYRDKQDHPRARDLYRQAMATSPERPDGYVGMGVWCEEEGRWNEAQDLYTQAVEIVRRRASTGNELAELGQLLAPVSGALYLRLAQAVGTDNLTAGLATVDRAIALGIKGEGKYPQRAAYQLKAEILEGLQRPLEAAEALFQAGQYYSWDQNLESACSLLERANRLNPKRVAIYWWLSDALRVASYTPKPPYVIAEKIARSLDVWNEGVNVGSPADTDAWAYVTRANISQMRANLPGANRSERLWEAATFAEQSLLLNPRLTLSWLALGQLHYALGNDVNALQATQKALLYEPENNRAMEDLIVTLVNLGRFAEVHPLLAKRSVMEPKAPGLVNAMYAHLALYEAPHDAVQGAYDAGLAASDAAIAAGWDMPWSRVDRARLLRLAGRPDDARREFDDLWRKFDKEDVDNAALHAWAALITGQEQAALAVFSTLADDRVLGMSTVQRYLGFCRLLRGELTSAQEHFDRSVELANSARKLDEWLVKDFEAAEVLEVLTGRPQAGAGRQMLGQCKDAASKKRVALMSPASPLEEAQQLIAMFKSNKETAGWAWIGANAAAARLNLDAHYWRQAVEIYQMLRGYPGRFYATQRGLQQAIDGLTAEADAAAAKLEVVRAASDYESILNIAEHALPDDRPRLTGICMRAAIKWFERAEIPEAREHFRNALLAYDGDSEAAARLVVSHAARLDISRIWALDDDWKAWAKELAANQQTNSDGLRALLNRARDALLEALGSHFQLSSAAGQGSNMVPLVTPIVLGLGRGLAEQAGPESRLLKQYLPEMCDHIRDEMGVVVPPVSVRDSRDDGELDQSFTIELNEIPQVLERVRGGWRYAPYPPERLAALGIPEEARQEAASDGYGGPGCWISPQYWTQVTEAGLELWPDLLYFVTHQLEEVLRRNLAALLDTQQVENLLAKWRKEPALESDISIALADQESHLRFVRLLQQLVQERVPITNAKELLEGLRANPLVKDEISDSLVAVRLCLREQLPGNQPQSIRLEITPEVERTILSSIHFQGGKSFFAILPEDAQQLLTDIRQLLRTPGQRCVVVTRDTRVRPLLRRLVEWEFPNLMVIAQEELLTPEAIGELSLSLKTPSGGNSTSEARG